MAEEPFQFYRNRYRDELREKMAGLPREKCVAIAARAAWRAAPLMFQGWINRNLQKQWWADYGEAIQASLVLAASTEADTALFVPRASASAATYSAASSSSAVAAKYASSSSAANAAAAVAGASSVETILDAFFDSASTFAADSATFAFAAYRDVPESHSLMLAATEADIVAAHKKEGILIACPLWPESTPRDWLERWSKQARSAMTSTPGAERPHAWLMGMMRGEPPIYGMKNWLNDWWLKHPDNTERTPAYSDMAAKLPEDADPFDGLLPSRHRPKKAPAKQEALRTEEPPVSEFPPLAQPSTSADPPSEPEEQIIKRYKLESTVSLVSDRAARELTPTAETCKEALASFLTSPKTQAPLNVSVEAPWGAGKTSFMHHLRRRLEAENIPTYWFNPWKHEAGKTLWAAFALEYERQAGAQLRPRWLRWLKNHPGCVKTPLAWVLDKGLFAPWRLVRRIWLNWCRLRTEELLLLGVRLVMWVALGWLLWFGVSNWSPWLLEKVSTLVADKAIPEWVAKLFPLVALVAPVWGILKDLVTITGDPVRQDLMAMLARNPHGDGVDDLHKFHYDFARLMRVYHPANAWWRRLCRWLVAVWDEVVYTMRAIVWLLRTQVLGQTLDQKPEPTVRPVLRRVAVFIDDLDRCEAPKAAEVLQSLHLMLDVGQLSASAAAQSRMPQMICILGMDREKVAAAVAAKHEKLLPLLLEPDAQGKVPRGSAMGFGHEFLEKFVQLTLHLPGMMGEDRLRYLLGITGVKPWGRSFPHFPFAPAGVLLQTPQVGSLPQEHLAPLSAADLPTPGPSSEVAAAEQVAEKMAVRLRVLEVDKLLHDGETAFGCALYVADALENNPRRLKQFVNLFRLRVYLAGALGLLDISTLDPESGSVKSGKLSAHHLAKLVALDLICPQSMGKMRTNPSLGFERLKELAEQEWPGLSNTISAMLNHGRTLDRNKTDDLYYLANAPLEAYFQQVAAVAPAPVVADAK